MGLVLVLLKCSILKEKWVVSGGRNAQQLAKNVVRKILGTVFGLCFGIGPSVLILHFADANVICADNFYFLCLCYKEFKHTIKVRCF